MATDNNPINIVEHGRGMVTIEEPNRIPDSACVLSQNEDIGIKGSFGPRSGSSLAGDRKTGNGYILTEYTMRRRDGLEIHVRTRQDDDEEESVVEWLNTRLNIWEPILAGLEPNADMVFIPWNTSSEDRSYFCNGTDNWRKWKGIISYVVSNTATTLNLLDATDFPSSGTVVVDGVEYTYSGKSTNQLTGLTALPALTLDQGVALVSTELAGMSSFKSNKAMGYAGRLWVAIGTGLFYTKSGNPEDFTYSTPRVVGDGGVEDFPEGGGTITGLAVREKYLIIMKPDILRTFYFDRTDVANEFPVSEPLGFAYDIGPANFQSIGGYLKEVFYVSKKAGLRQLTNILNASGQATAAFDIADLFEDIRNLLDDIDFSEAVTTVWDQKVLVACKETSDSAGNDLVIVKDRKSGGLTYYRGWFVNSWTQAHGSLYYGSSVQPNTFKCFDGNSDDGQAIAVRRITKRYDFGEPSRQKESTLIYVDGVIGDGTIIKILIRQDEKGRKTVTERNIRFDGSYVITNPDNALGEYELGSQPLGGLLEEQLPLNFFRVYLTMPPTNHYNFDLDITSDELGANYKILTIAPNPVLQAEPPASLKLST